MAMPVPVREHRPLLEADVVERARRGDAGAFSQIVRAYQKRVFGTVGRLIGRPEDVEDVAQEIFVRLYYSLGQLRSPELFEAWLNRLVANTACDYLRRKRRSREVCLSDLGEEQSQLAFQKAATRMGSDDRHYSRLRDRVDALLARIPARDRVLLVLKEVEGFSLRELEGVYGVESNVLKRRLFRARQRTLKTMQAARPERATA